ncbi:RagB/SusD family nutrient uptake outer membrane protein [Sphingobacterium shayense]|uniref:RagB/SusD family nutrient uptake outer membrane protein n=1 Tax=Sphingobacterium shayense TaxID=626343 RepID=UPI0015542BF5|nr:RagB/SusD family nutrient uptake outer membrane protein [Sphingobacterium shayense]NQD72025.1 RagB/SusD family nutrient uptake outer membrane protein [Sphingobacterium shayense]
MKRISLFLCLATILGLASCYKLDTEPYSQVSAPTFWQNEDQALAGVLGVYSDLQNDNTFGLQFNYDGLTDIGLGYDGAGLGDIIAGTFTDRTSLVVSRWQSGYDLIQRSNHAISQIQKMDLDEGVKNVFLGELRFLRGLMYFQLTNLFGDLPIYDESVDLNVEFSSLNNPRATQEELYAFIHADLDFATANLPVSYEVKHYGRVTKGAAFALRGKVNLYQKKWTDAIADFEEIVYNKGNNYGYVLAEDYASLFTMEGDQQPEMIFAIQNLGGTGFPNGMPLAFYLGTRSTFGSCWNSVMPSTRLADSYENIDGSPFDWNKHYPNFNQDNAVKKEALMATQNAGTLTHVPDTAKIRQIYQGRDPRMNQSIIVPYSFYLGWNANAERSMQFVLATGVNENFGQIRNNRGWLTYLWRKFVPEGDMNGALTNRADTPINFPLIRLADVLLMLSEAYNETGQLDKAIAELNKVRMRSTMPGLNSGPSFLSVTNKTEMQRRIRHERSVELAGEGLRYFDLKRWEALDEVSSGYIEKSIVGDNLVTRGYQARHRLWPVPGQEREMNSNLTQNAGW